MEPLTCKIRMAYELISAVANGATALCTAGLVGVAFFQINAIREESRKWETVRACNRYDTDPVLFQCSKTIRSFTNGKNYDLTTVQPALQEVRTILNYFESLAVGVKQGIYVKDIVYDHLHEVIDLSVDCFMDSSFKNDIYFEGLKRLKSMRDEWKHTDCNTSYKG